MQLTHVPTRGRAFVRADKRGAAVVAAAILSQVPPLRYMHTITTWLPPTAGENETSSIAVSLLSGTLTVRTMPAAMLGCRCLFQWLVTLPIIAEEMWESQFARGLIRREKAFYSFFCAYLSG